MMPARSVAAYDFRDEIMARNYNPADSTLKRKLVFNVETSDTGTTHGLPIKERRTITNWKRIGTHDLRRRGGLVQRRPRLSRESSGLARRPERSADGGEIEGVIGQRPPAASKCASSAWTIGMITS